MAQRHLAAEEMISGNEGQVQANIDGRIFELAEIRKLDATLNKKKAETKVLGFRGTINKPQGYSGTGNMTIYYNTSMWAEIMENYVKNGKDVYFDIIVKNDDPSSIIGAQRVKLNKCNLNELVIAKIDADAEFLDTDLAFTFEDYDLLDKFTRTW